MVGLLEFADKMERRADALPRAANQLKINAAAQIVQELVLETPVDTSQALSNWAVGIGVAPENFVPPYIAGKAGSTQAASALAAYQAALDVLANVKPGDVIYISNNAPYIVLLNQGSSKQAPAGFVEASVQRAQLWLQSDGAKVNLDGR